MSKLEIFGVEYPMAYTVAAQAELSKRFGGIDKIGSALKSDNFDSTLENVVFMASALMKGAEDRERVRCAALGTDYDGKRSLSFEELMNSLENKDMQRVSQAVVATINEGNAATVELKEEKRKNADATP